MIKKEDLERLNAYRSESEVRAKLRQWKMWLALDGVNVFQEEGASENYRVPAHSLVRLISAWTWRWRECWRTFE